MGQQLAQAGAAGSSGAAASAPAASQGMAPSLWSKLRSDDFRKGLMDVGSTMYNRGSGSDSGMTSDIMMQALQQQMAEAQKKSESGSGLLNALKGL